MNVSSTTTRMPSRTSRRTFAAAVVSALCALVLSSFSFAADVNAVAADGTPRFSGDEGQAASAQMNSPQGVCADGAGNLFITDAANFVIRRVQLGAGVITTYAGTPQSPGCTGDGGPRERRPAVGARWDRLRQRQSPNR